MDAQYINKWMKEVKRVEKLVKSRINGKDDENRPTQWELRKLQEMKRRLLKDKYMYGSYQEMLAEWGRPSRGSYWRRRFVGLNEEEA